MDKYIGLLFKSGHTSRCLCFIVSLFLATVTASPGMEDNGRLHEETACDRSEINLLCPGSDLINVRIATYGRQDDLTCSSEPGQMTNTHCDLPNALQVVSHKCDGKSECSFTVGQATFTDPCPGTRKYLNVVWECVPFLVTCPGTLKSATAVDQYTTTRSVNAAWLRDPSQQTQKIYYMGWSKYEISQLYEYGSPDSMTRSQAITFHHLPDRVDGTGFVVYDGSIYYNKERSRTIVRYDLGKERVAMQRDLPNANYHGTSPYAIMMATDIDMAVDENGLWVIYATEANGGNIVVSRLQHHSLEILNTWSTQYEKLSALNAFIACGVLYVVNYDTLRIDYMFNTTSNAGKVVNVPIPGLTETTSAIEYNPKDQMLYVWDNRVASSYKLKFEVIAPTTTTTTTTTTTPTVMPVTITTTKPPSGSQSSTTPSRVVPTTTTTTKAPDRTKKYCVGKTASGLSWPNTTFTKIAILRCPGNSAGQAIWICGGNVSHPQWTTSEPDLTQCSSKWIKDLEEELNVGVASISSLSQKLLEQIREKRSEMTSWDIVKIINFLKRVLVESTSNVRNAATVTDSILKCTSQLLQPDLANLWIALGKATQRKMATLLSSTLEDAAFFLVKDMSVKNNGEPSQPTTNPAAWTPSTSVAWSEPYATLAIRVKPVDPRSGGDPTQSNRRTTIVWNSGHGDSVLMDDKALTDALHSKPGQELAVVHLSFKNLGNYIADSRGLGSVEYPVNSQVISLSAKSVNSDSRVLVGPAGSLQLKRPVVLNLQHNSKHYANHVCAFWNDTHSPTSDGYWSESGCRRVSGNSTHTTCHCDHLTNFVVLSSNSPFPASGNEQPDPTPDTLTGQIEYLNIVRAGMIVSVAVLLFVVVTLCRYSRELDLNTVHKNLVFSLLVSEVVFLIGIHQTEVITLCMTVAALLHYGILCVFTWAALECFHHRIVLSDSRERNDRWRYYYIVGYGLPAIVVVISAAVDHKGYANPAICWLQTDGGFIWSFIAPCCIAICVCVGLISFVLYKLTNRKSTHTDLTLPSNIRQDTASTCVLMFLLCAMWSCGFMWLSGFQSQLTAWLFCLFCSMHGIASLLLYCVIPREVRCLSSCVSSHFKRKTNDRYRHNTSMSGVRLVPNSLRLNTRGDGTTTYSEYHYSGHSGTATTLIPVSGNHRVALAKAASVMEGGEVSPLVPANPSLSHDLVTSNCARASAREAAGRSSASSIDDTDPKLPSSGYRAQAQQAQTWNEYVHTDARSHFGYTSNRGDHHVLPCHASNCSLHHGYNGPPIVPPHTELPQQYEQPTTSYCACTTSTAYSCCYDHLHDDPMVRNQTQTQSQSRSCRKCHLQTRAPTSAPACHRRSQPHHYETLGPFLQAEEIDAADQERQSLNGNIPFKSCPPAMMYRHRYEDVEPQTVCIQTMEHQLTCNHVTGTRRCNRASAINDPSSCANEGYGSGYPHRQLMHKHNTAGPSKCDCAYYSARNGRSSDPLSTDQGYDTDSQQPGQAAYRNSHSDSECLQVPATAVRAHSADNDPSVSKYGNRLRAVDHGTSNQIAPANESLQDIARVDHRRQSARSPSVGSDAGSENDREVEFINSTSSAAPSPQANSESLKDSFHGASVHNDGTAVTAIDTSKGGRMSATGSVTSWAALAGSNPRAVNPMYGANKSGKMKSTMDPQVILAKARQQRDVRRSIDSVDSSPSDEKSSDGMPQRYNGYTLPGTAETGTKARIDLRSGGISMITNL